MMIFGDCGVMKSGLQVTSAAAACALILNAAMSYGAVPEAETLRLNDSSRKESSMSGSVTTTVPEAPRNVLQLKDADDLMAKYVRLADLTFDEFTPEAIEAIFGIKFDPRHDTGEGSFTTGFSLPIPKESTVNQSPLVLFYSRRSLFGMVDMEVHWTDYPPPSVSTLKNKRPSWKSTVGSSSRPKIFTEDGMCWIHSFAPTEIGITTSLLNGWGVEIASSDSSFAMSLL